MVNSELAKIPPPHQRRPTGNECLVMSLIVLFLFPVLGVLVGWLCRLPDFDGVDSKSLNFSGRMIAFNVQLIAIDVDGATLTLDWLIVDDTCMRDSNESHCTDVGIYFHTNGLLQPKVDQRLSNRRPTAPVFTWTPERDLYGNDTAFRTQLAFSAVRPNLAARQWYPFDEYRATLFIFALDAANETVGVRISSSSGVNSGFKVEKDVARAPSGAINYELVILRGGILRVYAIVIVILVWLITLLFCFAVIFAVFWGRFLERQLLIIPVSTIVSFSQLRSILPGIAADRSTIIDYVGFLPCFTLLAFGAFLLLGQSFICPEGWKYYRRKPADHECHLPLPLPWTKALPSSLVHVQH